MQVRLDKRARIIADGGQAYPVDLLRDHTLVQVRQKYTDDTGELTQRHCPSRSIVPLGVSI